MKPDPETYEGILARLHLRAILPALADLIEIDETAQAIARKMNLALCFRSWSGIETLLQFEAGKLIIDPATENFAPLKLAFPSDKQVNNLFLHRAFPLVLPNWRLWKLPQMLKFRRLSTRMESILKADPVSLRSDPLLLQTHIHLLIGSLIPSAFTTLARHENASKDILAGNSGLIQLQISGYPIQSWINCRGPDSTTSGSGTAPRSPDLVITFRDLETALLSTRLELDALAATSGGDIKLEGKIPLGDAANAVLDRISLYLTI